MTKADRLRRYVDNGLPSKLKGIELFDSRVYQWTAPECVRSCSTEYIPSGAIQIRVEVVEEQAYGDINNYAYIEFLVPSEVDYDELVRRATEKLTEEFEDLEAHEKEYKKERAAQERAEYERLRKKYGDAK